MYYPPETARWRVAALAISLTLGVAGSYALGQSLGHRAPPPAAAHHTTVTRPLGSASGSLSTAVPTATPRPALPSAAPAHPLNDTSHGDKHAGGEHGPKSHHDGSKPAGPAGGDHHGGGND